MELLKEEWLESMERRLEDKENKRRELSDLSYDLIKTCGLLVSNLHRGSPRAEELMDQAASLHSKLIQEVRALPELNYSDEQTAFSEYVEARCLYSLMRRGELPDPSEFYDDESFALGLADLIGELKRALMNRVIEGKYDEASRLFGWMQELFDSLLRFEYPRSVVRGLKRKLDVDRSVLEDARMVLANAKFSSKRRKST
jgi:translin